MTHTIVQTIQNTGNGKFLYQNTHGDWIILSTTQAKAFVQKEMNVQSNGIKKRLYQSMLYSVAF